VTITVLDVASIAPEAASGVELRRFLTAATVGARSVEGSAVRLEPGAVLGPLTEPDRHQLVYVTDGEPVALFAGERHELRPGRGIYCEPGEPCALENPGPTPAAFYRFVVARS
jgi:quercetin dioxygenase-like cupin family protein